MYLCYIAYRWYHNIWILTEKEIIAVTWLLLKRDIQYTDFTDIQSVETEQNGVLDMVLNRGNVHIRLAGNGNPFVIRRVPHPHQVAMEINRHLA